MAYLAVRIISNNPSGKKETSSVREALSLVIDQVKILLENLQMVYPSVIILPHKAEDRVGVDSNYDSMRKYFYQLYVHIHVLQCNYVLLYTT
jgi:hypothetical protein